MKTYNQANCTGQIRGQPSQIYLHSYNLAKCIDGDINLAYRLRFKNFLFFI